MKQYLNKGIFLNIYFILFTSCLLYRFINVILDHSLKEYWGITEWLINYQGGFVRRGLRGELVFQLNKCFNLDPYTVITIITTIAFLSLTYFFIKGFRKKGYSLFILPFVFFLGGPILNNYWMRADSMILIIFVGVIYFAVKKPRFYLLWINLFAILGSLIHEIFAFVCLPILIFLLINNFKGRFTTFLSFIYSCIVILPSIFSTLMVSYFKGTSATAFAIWESWKSVEFPHCALVEMEKMNMGAIAGIGLTVWRGVSRFSGKFIKSFDLDLYGPLILLLTILVVYFILTNIDRFNDKILGYKPKDGNNKKHVSMVLLFQFCATAPLYIIGNDYSRWIFLWVCSSFILLILLPCKKLELVYPKVVENVSVTINDALVRFMGDSKGVTTLLTLIIGFPLYSWNLEGAITTSSLYIVLSSISSVFKIGLGLLGIQL